MKHPRVMIQLTRMLLIGALVVMLLLSGITTIMPAVTAGPSDSHYQDKIDDSVINMTSVEERLEILVRYDDSVAEFKAKNAIMLADRTADLLDSYETLNMLRVKMLSSQIVELAKNVIITRIWSNEIAPIKQATTTIVSSVDPEDYVPLIDRIGARNLVEQGYNGTGVVIAVLDTGVDPLSSDMSVSAFASFVEADTLPLDLIGHGNYAASVALGNGTTSDGKYAGIAPGATLLSAKVTLGGLFASPSWIVLGIEWAVSRGADIILLPFNTLGAPNDAVTVALEIA
ncbi:MAG: S8 family serine peptidase, partial [Candidatus Thorarchaeota archaeon]|nr:S8 family serine peptidase [Candidatus Thorarchaeota archaeon]